jgi:putative effector of murein hydrolase LrgA (UPF0299 family)
VNFLCVYILWLSSVHVATGPRIGWDGTIITFRKKLHSLKISTLIILLLLLLLFIDVLYYYNLCVLVCCLLNYFVFLLCPRSVSVISLLGVVSSTIIPNN